jgi:26S proteasome regulatory subunit T5
MSSNDLEGDDIWGDSGGGAAGGSGSGDDDNNTGSADAGTSTNMDAEESKQAEPEPESLEDDETRHMSIGELRQRIHLLNNDIRVMKSDVQRITHESRGQRDAIRENQEKIKMNKQLPYLVANIVEVLEPDAEDGTFD